uniref:Uncharacterized protein n=1 Tax=Aliivibrio wodanis TaxID=80852 RepID=A0A5Q4YZU1_9GAMM|nr:hypothetical protein AW0309160_02577 [Aliivibrio wodanis]
MKGLNIKNVLISITLVGVYASTLVYLSNYI